MCSSSNDVVGNAINIKDCLCKFKSCFFYLLSLFADAYHFAYNGLLADASVNELYWYCIRSDSALHQQCICIALALHIYRNLLENEYVNKVLQMQCYCSASASM